MARYETSLSTLQARTILYYIEKHAPAMYDKYDIEDFAFEVVEKIENDFPAQFPVDDSNGKANNPHFSYLAFTFAACARFAIKAGSLPILEYLSILAEVKEENEKDIHDFGAFGDLFEILVRCALMRKLSLVKWSALTVKAINTADIVSKKYGIIEVGHNGKTLSFGTMYDYMQGDYNSVIYGVFSEEDKKEVYKLCREKKYEKAIDYICSYSAYWASKYDFQNDMDNLTRGKGIAVKACGVQVVYNAGKYNAFVNALEEGKITSLAEILNR
jgi:hypothetical protein